MRLVLLIGIRLYWYFIPKSKRRCCIFRESCSQYVYRITSKNGFVHGLKAFRFRYSNCRGGCGIFTNPITQETQLILPNGEVLSENQIAKRLLKPI
ncbi:membrane protein insertion efficiency factor YidD [Muricauda sp. HICW]|uniref:Membrane protein insertion efficiency factor YidD n=1 Tax=Flagellimonas chongwuensis TaxID=2697365 RepID=A0A850NL85_9FLAO|nr:membrane protein insertion efficiency factor YidD [Allomuricauda chongwuensis]NVN18027.1 membrane protein insertion efficiency factor YidD [Allomuricauda chongwuensis]